ncbi:MAG: hypothetical protein HY721_21555 [Planctomycetes bacterium]|nr:hypothetical protein [Planctomycetota bacterium]
MEETARSRPRALERFLESFFQERNIQWLLGTGVLILLGSSFMLVKSHWLEITPAWKCLVLLGYTALAYGAGRVTCFRMGLRRTGTVLLALTVLLVPLDFLALHWLCPAAGSEGPSRALHWALLAATGAFAWAASRRIFEHFLRGPQRTFLASYLALAAAGALAPALPRGLAPYLAPWTALALWAVLAAGCVKVSRHVFWLVEERRAPRVFGFFPVLLLGGQFVAVFLLHLAAEIDAAWLGFGLVLAAVPVFLAADAVARVFEERTGGVVRPIPASIILPFGLGILLCAGGLVLAATEIFAERPGAFALVPAAAGTAFIMTLAARRTRKEAFAWAALAALTLAYNFSPTYFRDLAARAVTGSAAALHEERLPYAFYGLTYLPLLGTLAFLGARRRAPSLEVFARPMRRFAEGLGVLLLAAAYSHPKALLPTGGALCGFFLADALLLRERRLLYPAIAGAVTAALGIVPFAGGVLGLDLPAGSCLLSLAALAALLLAPGRRLDRAAASWAAPGEAAAPCAAASLALAAACAGVWLVGAFVQAPGGAAIASAALLSAALGAHAFRWPIAGIGEAAAAFPLAAVVATCAQRGASFPGLASLGTALAVILWSASSLVSRRGPARAATALGLPAMRVATFALAAGLATVLPLLHVKGILLHGEGPGREDLTATFHGLLTSGLAAAWAFAEARRAGSAGLTALGSLNVLGWTGAVAMTRLGLPSAEWLPFAWTLLAAAALPARRLAPRLDWALAGVFTAATAASLVWLDWPPRAAGLAAAAGVVALARLEGRPGMRGLACALGTWQAVLIAARLFAPGIDSLPELLEQCPVEAALPAAFVASAGVLLSQSLSRGVPAKLDAVFLGHRLALRAAAAAGLAAPFLVRGEVEPAGAFFAAGSFLLLAAAELRRACEWADPRLAWAGEAIAGAGVAYLTWFGFIPLETGLSVHVLAAGAYAFHGLSRLVLKGKKTPVLAEPFRRTALALPLAAAAAAVARHAAGAEVAWLGASSLALLLAAGFYFWRGIEERRRGLLVLALAVVDVAFLLLWRELEWTDPQLYLVPVGATVLALVELLHSEIPEKLHDPLRYLGALVILVSPVFHIAEGSWLHYLSLMLLSALVIVASIGVRARATLYAGAAFLAADLAAMVVHASRENRNVLWLVGVGLGAAVVVLAALCENRREVLLQKLRAASARLETWR